jgi:hypothetical protein
MSDSTSSFVAGTIKVMVQGLAQPVATNGYVEQVPDPTDTRAKLVRLTENGVALRVACAGAKHQLQSIAVARLGESGVSQLAGSHRAHRRARGNAHSLKRQARSHGASSGHHQVEIRPRCDRHRRRARRRGRSLRHHRPGTRWQWRSLSVRRGARLDLPRPTCRAGLPLARSLRYGSARG